MSDLAISLLSGSAATIVAAVVVWAIIAKISGLASQLADTRVGLVAANATNQTKSAELADEQAARKRLEVQYAAAAAEIDKIRREDVARATDEDAVAMADGDLGTPGGSPVVVRPVPGSAAGDGMLMVPDWNAAAPNGADGPVPAAATVLPVDGPAPAGGQVVPPVRA